MAGNKDLLCFQITNKTDGLVMFAGTISTSPGAGGGVDTDPITAVAGATAQIEFRYVPAGSNWEDAPQDPSLLVGGTIELFELEGVPAGTWILAGKGSHQKYDLDGVVPPGVAWAGWLLTYTRGGNNTMILGTGIVAMGDSRYYTRHKFAADATDAIITGFFTATALLSEAKLISVMKSIMFDDTGIPEGDANPEYRAKLLCTYPGDRATVIELPAVATPSPDFQGWFNSNKSALVNEYGDAPLAIVQHDVRQERKARGR